MAVLNGREVDIMAYVLTNGNYYIRITENGGVAKTKDVNEAQIYLTMEKAKERLEKAPSKTKGYYILDIVTNEKYKLIGAGEELDFLKKQEKSVQLLHGRLHFKKHAQRQWRRYPRHLHG